MQPTRIAIAVVEWRNAFLVGVRAADVVLAGHAEFPGGKILPDESPAAAAARECWEETGLAVEAREELAVIVHEYPHGAVELHFWRCAPRGNEDKIITNPRPPFRWTNREALATLPFPEANAPIITQLLER